MKSVVVLYASSHGSTRRVVKRLGDMIEFPFDLYDVKTLGDASDLSRYDVFVFFSPTYGNEELQLDMERFLLNFKLDMSSKHYAICELGNYYGYENDFGAMRIMRFHLKRLSGNELLSPLSMDSLPKKDWKALSAWCDELNRRLRDIHA
ncbi:MAG TPA: flavodoxin family protein [Nitrospira sp.]|nr:flavodoxin family protein [Nitrospira sp.]